MEGTEEEYCLSRGDIVQQGSVVASSVPLLSLERELSRVVETTCTCTSCTTVLNCKIYCLHLHKSTYISTWIFGMQEELMMGWT